MRNLSGKFTLLLPIIMVMMVACIAPLSGQLPILEPSPMTAVALPTVSTAQAFCADSEQVTPTECEALVALYVSTKGVDWKDHTGWLTEAAPCTWYGVTCIDGKIDKINLNDNGLRGSLPETIRGLSNLRQLYLQVNEISGPIPVGLGELTQLRVLLLSRNQFNGAIPESLGDLRDLIVLYLDGNQLTGSIPASLGNLSQLRYLYLQSNQLSGPIPNTFGNLTGLQDLHLYENRLQGPIPDNLDVLPQLEHVKLENNDDSLCLPAKLQAWAAGRSIYNPPPGGICQ